jgi:hypothetical protein
MTAPINQQSPLLPTTTVLPTDQDELIVRLTTNYTQMAQNINLKEIGIFETTEIISGQQWFNAADPNNRRGVFRKVISGPAVAAGATATLAHGLGTITSFTAIYGTAVTVVVDYRPIPYASATAVNTQIEIKVNATNVIVINGAAAPNITSMLIVLEYLKN